MDRDDAIAYLLGLGNEVLAMKLELGAVTLLLERLGSPHLAFPSALIAGTNGKGSVAAMLDSIAREAGLMPGLYTSPHLVDIEERVRVGGRPVSGARFAELATRVREAAEALVGEDALPATPTFFEQVTAVAFVELAARGVDLGVVEVGMGGRLDATNVLAPVVSVITPVSLDHQKYLGDTVARIAAEKAGIIKAGSAAVIARQHPDALAVLARRCEECGVKPVFTGHAEIHHSERGRFTVSYTTEEDRYDRLLVGLRGRHQVENALAAIHAAEALRRSGLAIPRAAIARGLARAEWPGRLELLPGVPGAPALLLDGAHNAAGASALRAYLDEFAHGPVTLVFGALEDKDAAEIAAALFPAADAVVFTRPGSPRAAAAGRLAALPLPVGVASRVTGSPEEALAVASEITPPDGLVVVAGSLYLVGEVRALLAGAHPAPAGGRA